MASGCILVNEDGQLVLSVNGDSGSHQGGFSRSYSAKVAIAILECQGADGLEAVATWLGSKGLACVPVHATGGVSDAGQEQE